MVLAVRTPGVSRDSPPTCLRRRTLAGSGIGGFPYHPRMPPAVAPQESETVPLPERLTPLREELISAAVMVSQIPGHSGSEEERGRWLLDRLIAQDIADAAPDAFGNAVARLPGRTGERTLMVVAHLDTIIPLDEDHNVTVLPDRLIGPGISDNSLAVAAVAMLPRCLEQAGVRLDSDLILVGSVKSLARNNHEGLGSLLDAFRDGHHAGGAIEPEAALCLEGIDQGRLNYFCIGTLRGDITCDVTPTAVTRSYGSESAVVVLHQIIAKMLGIELPQQPFTRIAINRLRAGVAYDTDPLHAELSFEATSHDDAMLDRVHREIRDIVMEIGARNAVATELDVFFRRRAGGLPFSHPLVKAAHDVMLELGIQPERGHSPSELSEFLSRQIPALTLGISTGSKNQRKPDFVRVEPLLRGMAQVVAVLQAIDGGVRQPESTGEAVA